MVEYWLRNSSLDEINSHQMLLLRWILKPIFSKHQIINLLVKRTSNNLFHKRVGVARSKFFIVLKNLWYVSVGYVLQGQAYRCMRPVVIQRSC